MLTIKVVLVFAILQSQTNATLLDFISAKHETISDIHIKLGEVLKSCFLSQPSTLVITRDLDGVVRGILDDSVVANVFLLDEKFDALQSHQNFPRWPMFLLTANSTTALTQMLQRLKSSSFWHADSTFFIVGIPKEGCDKASSLLWTSWEMNLLKSFYICEDLASGITLHTYNPFTNRAPTPWKSVETRANGRWTLYSRSLSKDTGNCKFLEFDKMEFLDGYEIAVATALKPGVSIKNHEILKPKELTKNILNFHAMSQPVIWAKMNVTPIIRAENALYEKIGRKKIIEMKLENRTYDYAIGGFVLFRVSNETSDFMYPISMYSVSIMTNHQNFLTPAEKIANFYSFGAMSLTGLVFFMTWIVFIFKYNEKMAAALEILRMALSTGMLRSFWGNPIRIYLFTVLWLVLVLNATFQGNMSLFLTKPTRIDLETLEDLKTHHVHIYVPESYHFAMMKYLQNFPKSRVHVVEDNDCTSYVLKNISAACIRATLPISYSAAKYDLHVSHEPIAKLYRINPYRAGWPLARKMDLYTSRLMASGLLTYWQDSSEILPLKKLETREAQATAPAIRKIKLVDLNFAFIILGIGLTISTLFFVVEVGGNPTKKRAPRFAKRAQLPRGRIIRPKNAIHSAKAR